MPGNGWVGASGVGRCVVAVTIRDIAAKLKVSPATVSHVLSGNAERRRISERTRRTVVRTAAAMNYRQNPLARQLRTGLTNTIGLVIREFSNPYFSHVVECIQAEAARHGLSVHAVSPQVDAANPQATIESVLERGVDGLLSTVIGFEGWERYFAQLWEQRIPCLIIGEDYGDVIPCDAVMVNVERAADQALEHLRRLGHRRIAYLRVGSRAELEGGRDRAVKRLIAEHGLAPEDVPTVYIEPGMEQALHAGRQLLQMQPRPTAVFAYNDIAAVGVIRAVRDADLRVPEDLSVVGCDNIVLARFLETPLSTISWPYEQMAEACIRQIRTRRNGDDWEQPSYRELESEFVVRRSTGACCQRVEQEA